jgi:regulatory protein
MTRRGPRNKDLRERALRLLTIRPRSEMELRDRLLMEGYGMDKIDNIIKEFKEKGYIDDREYAEMIVRSLSVRRGYGSIRIKLELKRKGIEEGVISELLREIVNPQEEMEKAKEALKRYMKRSKLKDDPLKIREGIYRHLKGKGFSQDIIYDILRGDGYFDNWERELK